MSLTLNASLWIAQAFLAASFCWGGYMKLFALPKLAKMWPWTNDLPAKYVKILGIIDIAGGIGVVLPSLLNLPPGLTVAAAFGCFLLQICAFIFHLRRHEISALPANIIFLSVSVFIIWGRWTSIPI